MKITYRRLWEGKKYEFLLLRKNMILMRLSTHAAMRRTVYQTER